MDFRILTPYGKVTTSIRKTYTAEEVAGVYLRAMLGNDFVSKQAQKPINTADFLTRIAKYLNNRMRRIIRLELEFG